MPKSQPPPEHPPASETRPNDTNKVPKIDDIIKEEKAKQQHKDQLADQHDNEHEYGYNLDDIPPQVLLESYNMSQMKEEEKKDGKVTCENEPKQTTTEADSDYMLAMQLQFLEGHERVDQGSVDKKSIDLRTTTKKSRKASRRKNANKKKAPIQPCFYHENSHVEDNNANANANANANVDANVPKVCYGNKRAISGTINKHNSDDWSEIHAQRLHDYNFNLGSASTFDDFHFGNKAYNSLRRDLEKKGFKKFDQPTAVDKK
jgi:hypothetical protein